MSSERLGVYDLLNRQTGLFEEAELWSPIAPEDLDDFCECWRPIFSARLQELKSKGALTLELLGDHDLQDAFWKWARKVEERGSQLEWQSFAVRADGHTQGLMFARVGSFARERSQRNLPLVDIDLLSTAPWNRLKLVEKPKFKGVGRLLLAAAVSLSFAEEFRGRIGLHALPQAESWYRDVCGMTDLGLDSTKMHYFEMTEAQASAFISDAN